MGESEDLNLFKDIFPFNLPPRIVVDRSFKYLDQSIIGITDTTLRDGQQGWRNLSIDESLKIYEVLAEIGGQGSIISTELFLYTHKDREVARKIKEYGYKYPKPIAWIRATYEDLRLVFDVGLDETVILTSISDYHIYYKLRVTRDRAVEKYLAVVEEALKRGVAVKCTLEDATRANVERNIIPFVNKLMRLSEKYGLPIKIKIADTLGVGLPFPYIPPPRGIPALIREIIERTGIKGEWVEFHGHNDLGLVVANHLAAWLYGAGMSNCTLFGIGERAGNCPLEVMLMHYVGIKGSTDDVNLKAIVKAANVIRSLGFRIPEFHPLIGENAFRTKAGIHIDGLLKNPEVYLPFNPLEVLGIPYTVAITPYSGRAAIALWINAHVKMSGNNRFKISKKDPRVKMIYNEVIRMFDHNGRRAALSDVEMLRLIKKYFPTLQFDIEEDIRSS